MMPGAWKTSGKPCGFATKLTLASIKCRSKNSLNSQGLFRPPCLLYFFGELTLNRPHSPGAGRAPPKPQRQAANHLGERERESSTALNPPRASHTTGLGQHEPCLWGQTPTSRSTDLESYCKLVETSIDRCLRDIFQRGWCKNVVQPFLPAGGLNETPNEPMPSMPSANVDRKQLRAVPMGRWSQRCCKDQGAWLQLHETTFFKSGALIL